MIEKLKKIVTEEKDEIRQQYKAQIKAVFDSYILKIGGNRCQNMEFRSKKK